MAAVLLALTAGCVTTSEKARVCRSLAKYPLGCPPDMVEVRVYHRDNSLPGSGDSMCVVRHQDKAAVCVARGGVWTCSETFPNW